jgi:nodulation protein E
MRAALSEARLDASEIDYVSAHGTGTLMNDVVETKALHRVFDSHAKTLLISSIKGALGHGLGSAGALQVAATALALQRQIAPPTTNFDKPDPECDLDYVPNIARAASLRAALCNAFAFGGLNAVLALARA